MRQQLVAFHIYDLLLRWQPVWERGVRLDRGQMGQEDGVLRHTLPRGDILHRHQLQPQLCHLHGAEDRERPLLSSHLSDPLHTRYGAHSLSFSLLEPVLSTVLFLFSSGVNGPEVQNVRRNGYLHVLRVGDVSSGRAGKK